MLEALTRAGVDLMYDCRKGECGLCLLDVGVRGRHPRPPRRVPQRRPAGRAAGRWRPACRGWPRGRGPARAGGGADLPLTCPGSAVVAATARAGARVLLLLGPARLACGRGSPSARVKRTQVEGAQHDTHGDGRHHRRTSGLLETSHCGRAPARRSTGRTRSASPPTAGRGWTTHRPRRRRGPWPMSSRSSTIDSALWACERTPAPTRSNATPSRGAPRGSEPQCTFSVSRWGTSSSMPPEAV